MSIPSSLPSSPCGHSHFFDSPLCQHQTLLQKIATIALHILTLGIPYIVCRVVPYCAAKLVSGTKYAFHLITGKSVASTSGNSTEIQLQRCEVPSHVTARLKQEAARSEQGDARLKRDAVLVVVKGLLEENPVEEVSYRSNRALYNIEAFKRLLHQHQERFQQATGENKLVLAVECLNVCYALCSLKADAKNEVAGSALIEMDMEIKDLNSLSEQNLEHMDVAIGGLSSLSEQDLKRICEAIEDLNSLSEEDFEQMYKAIQDLEPPSEQDLNHINAVLTYLNSPEKRLERFVLGFIEMALHA